ncbi:MAG: type II toxin-antitoxin system VapC family toxin [Anaerolineae bacterium]|nr:type II toxin-antitoxin system VapC family toxin [Anaerolineae bacterium]MCO5190803.1 type II toxin-antitoxin system VapC family toxin [Anaerolineae bacterium]MCO5207802.1 type II toxin-antitoxin system VapC family toxin [Anaerolineae bacterium]
MIALDASALLAFLFRESGHEIVAQHIGDSVLSTVNLSEVLARFVRDGHSAEAVLHKIQRTSIKIVPFSPQQALLAANIIPATRPWGLSMADRACLALAMERQIPALSADRTWQDAQLTVDVILIR